MLSSPYLYVFDHDGNLHVCNAGCQTECRFGGAGPVHWCRTCHIRTYNGLFNCQKCVCLAKPSAEFPGSTCNAWMRTSAEKPIFCVCTKQAQP